MPSRELEAILFASGEPLSIDYIKKILKISDLEPIISDLEKAIEGRAVTLLKLGDKLQLCTKPKYSEIIREALEERKEAKLSKPALEVLVAAAYYQPITKTKIEKIRGVCSANTVNMLCYKGFLEECGHLDVVGRPKLYRTTDKFLRVFGIESLENLPDVSEFLKKEIVGDL